MSFAQNVAPLLEGAFAGKTLTAHLLREEGWIIDLREGDSSALRFPVVPQDLYPLFYRVFPEACVTLHQQPVQEPKSILEWLRSRIDRSLIDREQWDNDAYWVIGTFFCEVS